MPIETKDELEQVLEDIKSRLSVIETAQTKPKDNEPKDDEPKSEEETESQVESEDEIEKLLNS